MSIEINPKYNIIEICQAFNISVNDFSNLVQKSSNRQAETLKDIAVAEAIPRFLQWFDDKVQQKKKSINSLALYRGYLKKFLHFIEVTNPEIKVTQLNEDLLYEFLQTYEGRNSTSTLSPYTTNNFIAIIRSLIKFCFKQRLISTDFRRDFEWEKTNPLPKYLNPEELSQLLSASLQLTNGYRSFAILTFLAGTGVRIGEALDLKINDINFKEGFFLIRNGKGNKSRHVPLDPNVRDVLLDYLNITGVDHIEPNLNGYIFTKDYGAHRPTKLTREAVESMFRKLCRKLNLNQSFTVHSLRHTFAVNCLRRGMPIHVLQQILGHNDPATTAIYTKLFPKDILAELNRHFPFQFGKLMLETVKEDVNH
ncbi:tyrosine-type recombinase/integrase [Paenibacillus andongensis]|uniref:tyrosine-type recombinase/integrase n=1 Tax=Paenibacillus andongensis TaxID=2975482 RepID=UPI0021BBB3AB|nr:tyrosine-type recombinase/integrase [Paenibacillus andongensis]